MAPTYLVPREDLIASLTTLRDALREESGDTSIVLSNGECLIAIIDAGVAVAEETLKDIVFNEENDFPHTFYELEHFPAEEYLQEATKCRTPWIRVEVDENGRLIFHPVILRTRT